MARNGTNAARRAAKEKARQEKAAAELEAAIQSEHEGKVRSGIERIVALNPGMTEGQAKRAIVQALASYYPGRQVS